MSSHTQTWAKVNAPVDVGVRGIVEALSGFEQLETIESCEATTDRGLWVCFRYGAYWKHPWRDLADFVLGYIAPNLSRVIGDSANVRLQATSSGQVFGELSIRPEAVSEVETALKQLAREFSGDRHRSSGYCDGRSGTSL